MGRYRRIIFAFDERKQDHIEESFSLLQPIVLEQKNI